MSERKTRGSVDASRYASAGVVLAGAILLFLFAGSWLDGKLGTGPWLTLVGAFVGAAAGFWWMIRELVIIPGQQNRAERSERER